MHDFWRPLGRREAVVDGKYSVDCYLDALAGAFAACRALERPALEADEAFTDRVARFLYHTPFPKMAMKAHRRLVEVDWSAARARWAVVEPRLDEAAEASYRELVAPGLRAVARVGQHLHRVALSLPRLAPRERGPGARESAPRPLLVRQRLLRRALHGDGAAHGRGGGRCRRGRARSPSGSWSTSTLYERFVRAGDAGGEPPSGFTGDFVFHGVRGERREYGRLAAALAA